MSQGKGKNLILLKLHVDFLRDLRLTGAAKIHSALVAVQGFIQENFSTVVNPGKVVFVVVVFSIQIFEFLTLSKYQSFH